MHQVSRLLVLGFPNDRDCRDLFRTLFPCDAGLRQCVAVMYGVYRV